VVLEWLSGAQSNTELSREHQMASSVLAEWKRPSGCSSHAWPFRLSEKRPKTVQLYGVITLSPTVDEEQVAEVFVRINSKGTILNQADFILTLMSVFWDEGRAELERFCGEARQPSASSASPFNYFIQPYPDQLLRVSVGLGFRRARLQHVYSILRGKDLETGEFSDERRVQQFAVLKEAQDQILNLQCWHEFLKTLLRAGYRRGEMITSQMTLVYTYTLFLIGKRDFRELNGAYPLHATPVVPPA
jgi:hypothetical protein